MAAEKRKVNTNVLHSSVGKDNYKLHLHNEDATKPTCLQKEENFYFCIFKILMTTHTQKENTKLF